MLAINYVPRKLLTTQVARSILTIEPFQARVAHVRTDYNSAEVLLMIVDKIR